MSDRFERILSLDKKFWCKDSPVLIEKGALLKDSYTNKYLVQLKFLNLCLKTVIGITLKVIYRDKINETSGEAEFTYTDLKAEKGNYFGDNKPLYIPNENAREFVFIVTKVVFDDNSQWNNENKFTEIEKTKVSAERNIIEQLKRDLNTYENISMPEFGDDHWYCVCGQFNINGEDECCKCKRNKEELKKVSDINTLKSNLAVYEKEEAERLEKERKKAAEKRKRNTKILKKCLVIVIVAVIGITGGKAIKKNIDYRRAEALTDSGKYDEATAIFRKLEDYKDSQQMIKYVEAEKMFEKGEYSISKSLFKEILQDEKFKDKLYQNAEKLFESETYVTAGDMFIELSDYKDSKDRAYQCAEKLSENGDYYNASSIFKGLENYKNSDDMYRESKYQYAESLLKTGSYMKAADAFKEIKGYKDADDMYKESRYKYAENLFGTKKYYSASDVFKGIEGYKDAGDRYKESIYKYAEALFEDGDYYLAVDKFEELGNYKDSQSKLAEVNAKIEENARLNAWRDIFHSWYN